MHSRQWRNSLLLVLSFLLLLPASLLSKEGPMPASYDLSVTIEPASGKIAVTGRIDVPLENARAREMQFALHETFVIKRLSVNGQSASFSFKAAKPTLIYPATRNVLINLPSDTQEGKIQIDLAYEGRLRELPEFGASSGQGLALDDRVNSRLVELASYSSWYPQFFAMGYPLAVNLKVSLPQGWIAICSGRKLEERLREGRATTRWSSPNDTDILIAASPNYKRKSDQLSAFAIEIYYTQLPDGFVDKEMDQVTNVTSVFTDYLGQTSIPGGTIKHVYSPKQKGQGRAGIARPGIIVTSEGLTLQGLKNDPKFSLFQDIAHEIAHFWWNFGAGQGDWINEAFAEYFSAVAVERVVSEQQFQNVLAGYRSQVRELPPDSPSLSTVRFDGSGFVVRYYKGSLLLNSMRRNLGDERFFQAARDFFQAYKGKSIGTTEFRTFWGERLGNEKASLDAWLDSSGGLPELEPR